MVFHNISNKAIIAFSAVSILCGCDKIDAADKQGEAGVKNPDQSNVAKADSEDATKKKDAVVLIKAKNEPDLLFQKNGNNGGVDVRFYGDVITIGALSQGFEIKNIVKSIVIEYKVLWAERQPRKRYQIDLDDLKKSIGALKEIPNMIDGLALGEEIRINIGDLSIRFGNSMQDEEQISFGDNGYYINVDSYQHNSGESARSLKEFASGFADFLTQLVAKAEEVKVKVTTSAKQATSN